MANDPIITRPGDPEFPALDPAVAHAYRSAPGHLVAEILDGELSLMGRPRPGHARATTRVYGQLRGFDDPRGDEPGGWVILDEPELRLGPIPDVLVPEVFAADAPAFISIAPDWVCEVLSPSTESTDRGKKMRVYRREGVGHLWLLDPMLKTLEVYRRENGRYSLIDTYEGDGPVRAEPFDAIELSLGSLWAR